MSSMRSSMSIKVLTFVLLLGSMVLFFALSPGSVRPSIEVLNGGKSCRVSSLQDFEVELSIDNRESITSIEANRRLLRFVVDLEITQTSSGIWELYSSSESRGKILSFPPNQPDPQFVGSGKREILDNGTYRLVREYSCVYDHLSDSEVALEHRQLRVLTTRLQPSPATQKPAQHTNTDTTGSRFFFHPSWFTTMVSSDSL